MESTDVAGKTLPHAFYFSQDIYEQESRAIFGDKAAGLFLGHRAFVPDSKNYWVIPHSENTEILVNDGGEIRVLDNICRHRYALMLSGKGKADKIVCPVHYWSYKMDGTLLRAPGFPCSEEDSCKDPAYNLGRRAIADYAGFISAAGDDTVRKALEAARQYTSLNFDTLHYLGVEECKNRVNWKDYVDTFLDLYHIEAYHPGLTGLVNSNRIENVFGDGFHVQAVRIKNTPLELAGGGYRPLAETYEKKLGKFQEEYGAIWITLYPHILIEIYEKLFIFSIVVPEGPEGCTVYKYSFCDPALAAYPDILALYQQFLDEVEREDVELMERISAGRKTLYARGEAEAGPFHPTKEDGVARFHNWVRAALGEGVHEAIRARA